LKTIGDCVGDAKSAYEKYIWSARPKTQTKYSLIIFRAIIDHGRTLKTPSGKSYVTATQEKQIAELDKLEKKIRRDK
jgi:hypothetical protein